MQIEQFQAVFRQKMKERNAHKRLNAIDEYLTNEYNLNIPENATSDQYLLHIMQLIRDNEDEADDILSDLVVILNDRYSNGEPYLFSSISTSMTAEKLRDEIAGIFDGIKAYDSFDFELLEEPTVDPMKQVVNAKFRYTEWFINSVTQERERELNSGTIHLHFFLNEKVCMSSRSGYNKLYSKLLHFIRDNLENFFFKHIYVQLKTKSMKNSSMSEFAPLTLLAIHLIFKKFRELGFNVQSVGSISFNNEKAPHVKNAKLGGNNLFKDKEVVERIFNGDKITKFTVSLFKMNPNNRAVIVNLTVDFKSILKFTFDESDFSETVIQNVCLELYKGIMNLIEADTTIEEGEQLLRQNLIKTAFTDNTAFYHLLKEIRDNLADITSDSPEITDKIFKYFHEKYNIEY
jgi:uncharacterized protein YqfB (UPF0267 family)